MKYLNKDQQKTLSDYSYANNNLEQIQKGDRVKFIIKKNLQFRQGGVVTEIINNTLVVKNVKYKYSYTINLNNHIIFYKKKTDKKRHFMEYILNGLNDNSIKVTKKLIKI